MSPRFDRLKPRDKKTGLFNVIIESRRPQIRPARATRTRRRVAADRRGRAIPRQAGIALTT